MKKNNPLSFLITFLLFTQITLANPIIELFFSEVQIDSNEWKIEFQDTPGVLSTLDSCFLTSMTDTSYFKNNISFYDYLLVITSDSMQTSFNINRMGDIIGFYNYEGWLLDEIVIGNLSGTVISSPFVHQSICLREWRELFQRYYYYLDNTPTFGYPNDSLNAEGYVSGIITDSLGNPIPEVEIVYDYYDAPPPYYYDISVFTDSTGYFILKDYARLNRLEIRKENYQTEYRSLQIWPEDTVSINVVLNSVIDAIEIEKDYCLDNYKLSQNYPNPFNNSTTFTYTLPKNNFVEIAIYDLSGKLVEKLFAGEQNPGEYKVRWNAESVSSGVYVYQLKTNDFINHKKCLLIK